jgi:2-polyprenyl-3-methyl-5-hydroxy-6-metoxy-1,4-benzoquinol methylase
MASPAKAMEMAREEIIRANRQFYKEIAAKYDHYESCASDPFFQKHLEDDLEIIAASPRTRSGPMQCLDCGGGTGNLTLKMLRRGWDVVVVDVSDDMLCILRSKVAAAGRRATFINDSVENFFSDSTQRFDLIAFSSVLHHLFSPLSVVKDAGSRIYPGGFFYSTFDPVPPSSQLAATYFGAIDTLLAKLTHDPADLLPGVSRRLRKLCVAPDSRHGRAVLSAGDLAEYHARKGIDDRLIAEVLELAGFVVEKKQYPVGRTRIMRWLNSRLQALLNFRILARRAELKPEVAAEELLVSQM